MAGTLAWDTKSMEVTVRAQSPASLQAFTTAALSLLAGNERIAAEATTDGLKLRCIWWPDLDEAWAVLAAGLDFELSWTEPVVILKYETVIVGGKPRNIILEPVLRVEVAVPELVVGSVMGDLCSRRGMITGMADSAEDRKIITAEVPLSELRGYPKTLEALSGGAASVSAELHSYQERPRYVDPDPNEPMSAALRA